MTSHTPLSCPEMSLAMKEAILAGEKDEVPVGAVIIDERRNILSHKGNAMRQLCDPSAHAEIRAMRAAVKKRNGRKLKDCTLIVTLEPCPMCACAIGEFRVGRIIFGAYDIKGGGIEHTMRVFSHLPQSLRPEIIGGIREKENSEILKRFFKKLRILSP